MMMLISISLILSMSFMFLSHPLSFGLILLLQTLMVTLITGLLNLNFWFSFILFLVMIGGLLILFMYMTSVASNEKFKFSNKIMYMVMFIILMTLLFSLMDQFFTNLNHFNLDMNNFNTTPNFSKSLSKFINFPMNNIFYMIIIYLLITMIMVTKITNIKAGPLRQK
uniref:NADH-ubiquinone oxidoreductase chain 6 n=1 Tax=Apomecyna saltator TaxID=2586296 RepID=A0A7T1WKY2_9CUCU|nr:NADH dehydrogenase subunit 6 [Apomecyna saltator]QPO99874.1 NADH dehydrogenase subunit 6 [Apomecyna saltator]